MDGSHPWESSMSTMSCNNHRNIQSFMKSPNGISGPINQPVAWGTKLSPFPRPPLTLATLLLADNAPLASHFTHFTPCTYLVASKKCRQQPSSMGPVARANLLNLLAAISFFGSLLNNWVIPSLKYLSPRQILHSAI